MKHTKCPGGLAALSANRQVGGSHRHPCTGGGYAPPGPTGIAPADSYPTTKKYPVKTLFLKKCFKMKDFGLTEVSTCGKGHLGRCNVQDEKESFIEQGKEAAGAG